MIHESHRQEWLNSAVAPSIIDLNVRSLSEQQSWEYLFYSDAIDRLNSGRVSSAWLKKYQFLDLSGGWWCSGVDPLNQCKEMMWGCYKPDKPRLDFEKKKPIKYEHPPKTQTRTFFLKITYSVGLKIAVRYGLEAEYLEHMVEAEGTPEQEDKYFWLFVELNPRIDITIVEGAKKAASLLSHGYAAMGIPGINGAVRAYRDGVKLVKPELIPEITPFTFFDEAIRQKPRQFTLCFDNDQKRQTRQNSNREISKLGRALEDLKCSVAVLGWSSPEKGVDDFIMAHGSAELDAIYQQAYSFGFWKASRHSALTYTPNLRINQRYLGVVPFPESGTAFLKSLHGTGKTESLDPLVREASNSGRKVLLLTHRIQLGRALCERLGLDYIDEVHGSETQGLLGYGICGDSLHPLSKARFNPEEWHGAIVIIDEIEQVLWHMLNSGTCQSDRIAILDTLTQLVQTVLSTGGLIVGQDADLSDLSIDYIRSMAGEVGRDIEPWILINDWKSKKGWDVICYAGKNASQLFNQLAKTVETGAVLVVCDSQKAKGKWSAINLESQLRARHPDKRILRIDSETVADKTHPAFGCVEHINEVVLNYDIIIATPTIGTGVSIDVRDYFKGVFGIFKGAVAATDTLQHLARLRDESVPRYLWVARRGLGTIGNESDDYNQVIKSKQKNLKANLQLLQNIDFDVDGFDPFHLRTWGMMAARVNAGMFHYRDTIFSLLKARGHNLIPCREVELDDTISSLRKQQELASQVGDWEKFNELEQELAPLDTEFEELKEAAEMADTEATDHRDANELHEAKQTCEAVELNKDQYKQLKDQKQKTPTERHAVRKHELKLRYAIDLNPPLILKDNKGWHPQLRLHYFLGLGREHLEARDRQHLTDHLERGNKRAWLPDIKLLSAQVKTLEVLGFGALMADPDKEYSNQSPEIIEIAAKMRQYKKDVKTYLNLSIPAKAKDMELVQYVLKNKLAAPLKQTRMVSGKDAEGKRVRIRIYKWQFPNDARTQIFQAWKERDDLRASEAEEAANRDSELGISGSGSVYIDISNPDPVAYPDPLPQTVMGSTLDPDPVAYPDPPITPEEEIGVCAGWLSEALNLEDPEAEITVRQLWGVMLDVGRQLGETAEAIAQKVLDHLTAGKQRRLCQWGLTG